MKQSLQKMLTKKSYMEGFAEPNKFKSKSGFNKSKKYPYNSVKRGSPKLAK